MESIRDAAHKYFYIWVIKIIEFIPFRKVKMRIECLQCALRWKLLETRAHGDTCMRQKTRKVARVPISCGMLYTSCCSICS